MGIYFLEHYGIKRRSGRWPYGSGENPYQHESWYLGEVERLRKQGMSDLDIAKGFEMTSSEFRQRITLANEEVKAANRSQAYRLKQKGYSNVAIAERLGVSEGTVRNYLKYSEDDRKKVTQTTSDILKDAVKEKTYVDVGAGTEQMLGISQVKLNTAIRALKDEGYTVHYIQIPQLGTQSNKTTLKVLAPPGTEWKDVNEHKFDIKTVQKFSDDGGRSYSSALPIVNLDSKRVKVRYAEDGGREKDGVIELRRGVEDISLGNAKYAQVRIGVNGTHYLKGMAMYSDDLPDGVDIIFNTNKHKGTPMLGEKDNTVLKAVKDDPANPFGASIRPKTYVDKDGKQKRSPLNIVNEEGDWDKWSKNLSSQFLSKQTPALAKKQLDLAYRSKKDEFDEIMSITNPSVKKMRLDSFADDCDSAAVHLKGAALPRQSTHVILPFPSMKDTEIYAPNFRIGEKVVLVRYPHGGIFEIPELTVNNNVKSAKRAIGQAKDAVGINSKVAERLSGADFDGDSVLVIPTRGQNIKTAKALKGLKDFDPQAAYPAYPGMKKMSSRTKQLKMGDVSNLITDMTIKGAPLDEICRAVKHSMVVIDAEKHNLNWRQSYIDNDIAGLKEQYQGGKNRGASTLISRASSEQRVGARKESIDPETGKRVYTYTGETYTNKQGKQVKRTISSTKMFEAEDAYSLSSGTRIESIYAEHANRLKALANQSRKNSISTKVIPYSPSAKKTYAPEVETLRAKLNVALKNRPIERQAQLLANSMVRTARQANPDMDNDDIKKLKGRCLTEARVRTGAKKNQIYITDKEWEAIQAGAISPSALKQILNNADQDRVKELSTPRSNKLMNTSNVSRAKQMLDNGYTQAEVADALGVSVSTLKRALA